MAPVKQMKPGPTKYLNGPPESEPPECPLCSVVFKYLFIKVKTVDNEYNHSNINLTNCNSKITIKANSVLFDITRLNTVRWFCGFGLVSGYL